MRMFRDLRIQLPPLALLEMVSGLCWEAQAAERVTFAVSPVAAGLQVVRASLPLPPGFLGTNQACAVATVGGKPQPVGCGCFLGIRRPTPSPALCAARW